MGKGPDIHLEINLSFKQILDLLGRLTDEQKVVVWNALKIDLEDKGLVTWAKGERGVMDIDKLAKSNEKKYKKPEVTIEMIRDWESDLPEEDEKEMTDEEFLKAVEEMS